MEMTMLEEEIEVGLEKPPTVFRKKQRRTVPMGTYLTRIREVQEYRKRLDDKRRAMDAKVDTITEQLAHKLLLRLDESSSSSSSRGRNGVGGGGDGDSKPLLLEGDNCDAEYNHKARSQSNATNEGGFLIGDRVRLREKRYHHNNNANTTNSKEPKIGTVKDMTKCYLYVQLDDGTNASYRKHHTSWKRMSSPK